ncbi:MAG: alpha-2-macroglobulin family protein [Scytolyngbya sp. HA4215-MV1]|nr:alpha-2-macroglobulin family protein [Scytolyngbya sp. HA4215-MV1]
MPAFRKLWVPFLLSLLLVLGFAQLGKAGLFDNNPLSVVTPVASPQLPEWIEQVSPVGEAPPLAQIRIRFKEPLIPLESLESPNQQAILEKFEISPAIPGRFRFLTPRMVGFQADQAIPQAFRAKVTLKAGLADLKNHQLQQDLSWTFNTEPIKLTNLPGTNGNPGNADNPLDLQPVLEVTSNTELDLNTLQQRVSLTAPGGGSVPLKVELKADDSVSAGAEFDPSQRTWTYVLTPQRSLQKATQYTLRFAPGLRSLKGNLLSETAFASQIFTYSSLTFQELQLIDQPDQSGAYGRFLTGGPQLLFNNGLDADSVESNIKVQPAIRQGTRLIRTVYEDDRVIQLNPWAFEPNTTYTLTIGANLKDQFGQTLGRNVNVQYQTGDVAADFWAPSGLNIFPTGKNLQLELSSVNLPEGGFKAVYQKVQPQDLVYADEYSLQTAGLLPATSEWQTIKLAKQPKNQTIHTPVPIAQKLGGSTGALAYGVQTRAYQYSDNGKQKWRIPTYTGLVQLTNLGVFAQWFPTSGMVRVHHLSDGAAAAGVKVEVYKSKVGAKSRPQPQPCATGTTDKTGTLLLAREALQQCIGKASGGFDEAPELLTIAYEGNDWAFTRSLQYSGSYGYGIYAGWLGGTPESRGILFSDRQLYQPGEKGWFTGNAYYIQDGVLKQDKNARYTVSMDAPDGKTKLLGNYTTNEFGTFSVPVTFSQNQPLGYYVIKAKSDRGVEITGDFRVAEFKLPNFKVDLNLNQAFAMVNQSVTASTQSNYLFGPPVEGGRVEYYVTRKQEYFVPQGWDAYSFGRRWFWPEESPTVSSDVLTVNQTLNPQGQSSQTVTVAKDLPYPMRYEVDAQVSDVSNLSVSSTKSFIALPSDRLIGLKSDFVADAGKPFSVAVIVTDPNGRAIANQAVRVELQKMTYSSVTRVVEGSGQRRNQVEYNTVAKAEVRSGSQAETVTLTPPESGTYRIRANFADASSEATAADAQIWATGDTPVYWGGRYRNNRIDLKLDKETYEPGETATVLIQSPYPEAELYLAVVRHQTLYRTVIKVSGSAPKVQFQVTPDMLPNAAVEAVLVRQGEPLTKVAPGSLKNLVGVGFAPFQVGIKEKYLQVEVKPTAASLAPGSQQTVEVQLKNAQGQPSAGQFTVMVVNDAVLQLSGYRPPDLVKTVYAEQDISTRFADNRPDVVLDPIPSPLQKGWGFGGGFAAGAGDTRIRKDFQPLAYYGTLVADATGRTGISFKLPDDLTTWRVLAVATDGEMRFGQGESTFLATQPLLTNPLLPQFARPGDRLQAGLSVINNTGKTGTVSINGTLSGSLQFANGAAGVETIQRDVTTSARAFRYPIVATQPGTAKIQFSSKLDNATDAFEVPLEVKPLEVTEQVVESGTTTTQVKLPLRVDANVVSSTGGLDIALASTLIPEISAPAKQVLWEEQLPFLEPAASQLAIAANLQILSRQYGQSFAEFDPVKQAAKALDRLQQLQRPDDGFASYPGQEQSDPFVSPYAAHSLAQATAAGLKVDANLVNRLKKYLSSLLANPGQYEFCREGLCKSQLRLEALSALAALGDRRSDFLADIYAQRQHLSVVEQIKLARHLALFPDWQDEATSLTGEIRKIVYETGRTATINMPETWEWLSSPTAVQAQALRLFIAQKSNVDSLDRLFEGLLSLRRDGAWATTYDNAEALTALVDYGQLQPTPPDFTAMAELAGKQLGTAQFQGYQKPSVEIAVPMADLPRGQNDLVLSKSGEGILHYLAAYRYRLQGDQPGRLSGLRVNRVIRPANQPQAVQTIGLAPPAQPLTVKPGQVFDIGLEITTDHPIDHLVITDPLPAGFEAIDASFQTSTPYFQAQSDSWQIDYQTIYHDRVVAYGNQFDAGVYTLHYLVRSVTPGVFLYPGAEAHLQYAPEEFGRTASSSLVVAE